MDSSELPDFIRKAEAVPRWIPLLFESIWLDSEKTREEKLKCLEEASLCWPPSVNVEFHKWKFQFKEDKGAEIMKMMNEESNSLKEIVKVLIEKYGDQLESISEKLKTIRGAFEDECCLHRWLKSEYCIIPYESLFRCGYPKSLIIKMESEEPYFEMRIELVSSPALETFLRLITGDNYFVGDFFPKTTPLHLLNRSLYGTTKDLRLLWDGVEESMDKQLITLLSDMTEQCRGRSVHISHDRNIHMLYVNFGLDDEYEDRGIEVGRVVEHNIKSVVNEGDENESDEEDRDQLEDIEITDIQFIY